MGRTVYFRNIYSPAAGIIYRSLTIDHEPLLYFTTVLTDGFLPPYPRLNLNSIHGEKNEERHRYICLYPQIIDNNDVFYSDFVFDQNYKQFNSVKMSTPNKLKMSIIYCRAPSYCWACFSFLDKFTVCINHVV